MRIQSPGLALVFSDDEIAEARRSGKLLSLDIELTHRCNLRCVYCYGEFGEKCRHELSQDEIIRVIDEAISLGLRTLTLTGGEPLLDKRYFNIAEYAVEHGVSVLLFTNGTLLTEQVSARLMELRVSPCVKLDSLTETVQDSLADCPGTLKKIHQGIRNLIDVGFTTEYPVLSVNSVVCRNNIDEIPYMWQWARNQDIKPSLTRLQPMGRARNRRDIVVSAEELHDLFVTLSAIDAEWDIIWEPNTPWAMNKACRRHYIGAFLDAEGNVQPCSGVPIKAGNVRESSLKHILASEIFTIARNIDEHLTGACRDCPQRHICYGCRSIALFQAGSFTAADPLCWHASLPAVSESTEYNQQGNMV